MSNLATTRDAVQQVLITAAETHARSSGFVQRDSKLSAAGFVQAVVFGWMGDAQASRAQLTQTAAIGGVAITAQGLNERFSPAAVSLLQSVLAEAVGLLIAGEATSVALLERFGAVRLFDATTITLPKELATEYPGCGDRHGSTAAMKLHVSFDLVSGTILGPEISAARQHDVRAELLQQPLAPGSLVVHDLGYFWLARFAALSEQHLYWLSRFKQGTQLFDESGAAIDLVALLADKQQFDLNVTIGQQRLGARLLVERVSDRQAEKRRRQLRRNAQRHGSTPSTQSLLLCAYTIAITNVPVERLSLAEAMALLAARWQVEILFKLWKSHGQIDEWRGRRPVAILCEVYAKLIALLVEHWVLLLGAWHKADRSILKAVKVIARGALMLAAAISDAQQLERVLTLLVQAQSNGSRVQRRRKHPSTFQRLDAFSP